MPDHKHILVVDDESQITRVLRTSLSAHGYDIRVANDGETALEIMKDWTPDLVITDLAMPNMDGLELCRRLRAKTQIPILVLSVRGEERTKVQALDAGADDYVTKPFGIEELLARVRANLRRTRPQESELVPIEVGDFKIDPGARSVFVKDRAVHLTPKNLTCWCISLVMQGKWSRTGLYWARSGAARGRSRWSICASSWLNSARKSNLRPTRRGTS